jgi:hypothetical protein
MSNQKICAADRDVSHVAGHFAWRYARQRGVSAQFQIPDNNRLWVVGHPSSCHIRVGPFLASPCVGETRRLHEFRHDIYVTSRFSQKR